MRRLIEERAAYLIVERYRTTALYKVQIGQRRVASRRAYSLFSLSTSLPPSLGPSLCLTAGFRSPSVRPALTRFRSRERRAILTTSPQCLQTSIIFRLRRKVGSHRIAACICKSRSRPEMAQKYLRFAKPFWPQFQALTLFPSSIPGHLPR